MEKTEIMKRYEAETDEIATWSWHNKEFVTDDVLDWAWEKIQKLQAENAQLKAQLTWRPVSVKPEKDQIVIATYLNGYGRRRRVRAVYIRQYEEESDYDADYEYNEENDTYYLKEGWYELIDNWDYYSSVAIVEGVVDHWLPMPPSPEGEVK